MLCSCITDVIHAQSFSIEGFENENISWTKNNNSILFEVIDSQAQEGSRSALIENLSSTSYGIEQVVTDIKAETYYELSTYIKTINPPPQKVFTRIAWYASEDASGSQLKTNDSEIISTESDWGQVIIKALAPPDAQSAKIRLLVSTGKAYFDSIQFQETVAETPTITPSLTTLPTPTIETHTSVSNILISEVMVYPNTNDSEWIEIYNGNSTDVTLSNWYIDDIESGGATPKAFTLTIPALGYATYELSTSIFNNASDEVRLLNSDQILVDEFSYQASEKGLSIGKSQNNGFCIQTPSQNSSNNTCNEIKTEDKKISVTPDPTLTASVLGAITKRTITPSPTKKIASKKTVPTLTKIASQKPDLDEEVIIQSDSIQNTDNDLKEPLLLLSGSYSLLAFISLVSKIFIFRYT